MSESIKRYKDKYSYSHQHQTQKRLNNFERPNPDNLSVINKGQPQMIDKEEIKDMSYQRPDKIQFNDQIDEQQRFYEENEDDDSDSEEEEVVYEESSKFVSENYSDYPIDESDESDLEKKINTDSISKDNVNNSDYFFIVPVEGEDQNIDNAPYVFFDLRNFPWNDIKLNELIEGKSLFKNPDNQTCSMIKALSDIDKFSVTSMADLLSQMNSFKFEDNKKNTSGNDLPNKLFDSIYNKKKNYLKLEPKEF